MTSNSNTCSSPNSHTKREALLGGPGSKLPFWLESLLSWMLAISCLSVALYHYALQIMISPSKQMTSDLLFLPLTTHSRKEVQSKSLIERYEQLTKYLEKTKPVSDWTEDDLVKLVRSNIIIRRLVSLIMKKYHKEFQTKTTLVESLTLLQKLTRIWPRLVELPLNENYFEFEISVVIPAYREDGMQLVIKLQHAHDLVDSASSKRRIEVILVHSNCTNFKLLEAAEFEFGRLTCIQFHRGGRGSCLNRGASVAKGRILTFLHADTRLPHNWNVAISQAFSSSNKMDKAIVNACAFGFGIDTEHLEGKGKCQTSADLYYPPGIRAVEQTANWRSHWFHLPYGDQCLSIPHYVFKFVGGFPHQCLMEDYEIVRLLRQRCSVGNEQLTILEETAKCSVRRWQKFGVLYVTYFNSKLVNLYASGRVTADELFRLYYGVDPKGANEPIPWESELERKLQEK
jgi:glycosyltransferase involved in cell wall biosynthesis